MYCHVTYYPPQSERCAWVNIALHYSGPGIYLPEHHVVHLIMSPVTSPPRERPLIQSCCSRERQSRRSAFVLIHLSVVRVQPPLPPFVFGLPSRPIVLHVQVHIPYIVLVVATIRSSFNPNIIPIEHTSRRSHCSRANLDAFNPNSWSVGVDHRKHRPTLDDLALCRFCRL
jgi:hypothetical protein